MRRFLIAISIIGTVLVAGTYVVAGTYARAATFQAAKPALVRGNQWFLKDATTTGPADSSFAYGSGGDIPFLADWNGDGTETPGVVRGNTWYLRNERSTGVADVVLTFGDAGDVPVVGDWDGDGVDTPGVVRGNLWLLRNENTTGIATVTFAFGEGGDKPIVGDWDGDGDSNPGVARAGHCIDCLDIWLIRSDNSTGVATSQFANQGAANPVPADWRGEGHSTPGWVERAHWVVTPSTGDTPVEFNFGSPSDTYLTWTK